MFTGFLYILRGYGMQTSLNEWMSLMSALELNLNEASLLDFYHMARTILVKKVTDYDRFDQAFAEYFKHITTDELLAKALKSWLAKAMTPNSVDKEMTDYIWGKLSLQEICTLLAQRLKEQKSRHDGGTKWVGTGGQTAFGNNGYAPYGIRVQGEEHRKSALKIATARNFKDFRDDTVLEVRQFQVALRKLRLLSNKDETKKTELAIDETIEQTGRRGGQLQIVLQRPRKNQTKLLLLMDSGGSMWPYAKLCSRLFKAVNEASQFKDLKIYYFHNCFYEQLFTKPSCQWQERISTKWVFTNLKPEYKVIVVGDADMGEAELLEVDGSVDDNHGNVLPGINWLRALKKRFPATIWLNPLHVKLWNFDYNTRTIGMIGREIPMYPLTVRGLEEGIKALLR